MRISQEQHDRRYAVILEHLNCELTGNIDKILDTFAGDCFFNLNGQLIQGRAGVRDFYREFFGAFKLLNFEGVARYDSDAALILEAKTYWLQYGRFKGLPVSNKKAVIPLLAIFHFDEDDRIQGETCFFDSADLLKQLGFMSGFMFVLIAIVSLFKKPS